MSLTFAFEQVEQVDRQRAGSSRQLIPALQVDQARRLRPHRVVLDERARSEIAQAAGCRTSGGSCRRCAPPTRRCRPLRARRLRPRSVLGETRPRQRHVAVEHQPFASGCSSWRTRRRTACSPGLARSRRCRRCRPAPSRGAASRARPCVCRCGMATVRTPTSAPLARTSGVTRSTGLPLSVVA